MTLNYLFFYCFFLTACFSSFVSSSPLHLTSYPSFSSACLPHTYTFPFLPSFLSILSLSLPLCPAFFTSPSPLHCSYLCLGDIIGGSGAKCWVTDWPTDIGHRYTGSEMDSKPCRLADRQTCSHKTSKKRERKRQSDTWTDGAAGRLTCSQAFQPKRSRQNVCGYQEGRHLRHVADTLTHSDLQ